MAGAALTPVPEAGALAEKKPRDGAVALTKVSKSEEAIFALKPGKAALVRLAASAQPFAPLVQFVSDGVQWKSTRKALAVQFAFCFLVLYSWAIAPTLLVTLGLCTLSHKKTEGAVDSDGTKPQAAEAFKARAEAIDAAWLQHALEKAATQLEHLTAVTMWEDPIVTGGFVAACAAVAALLFAFVPFQWAVLFGGLYTMRPPSWRVVPGPIENLLNRMPDKSEEYTRLMGGGAAA